MDTPRTTEQHLAIRKYLSPLVRPRGYGEDGDEKVIDKVLSLGIIDQDRVLELIAEDEELKAQKAAKRAEK